jgi:hypothetical protein
MDYSIDEIRKEWIARLISVWEPPRYPHCSNCLNAKVSGDPSDPQVRCSHGYGTPRSLVSLIRGKNGRGFKAAKGCLNWEEAG